MLLQHTNSGWRRKHDIDAVVLHDLPPYSGVRAHWQSLVEYGGKAGDQGRINDIGMAYGPADVRRGEYGVARAAAINVFHRRGHGDGVAAHVALHAFRLAGGAGRVQNI